MGRPKAARNVKISPWLSAKIDCKEGRFIQVGNSLLLSERLHGLSAGARWLYLCMAMESGGKPELTFVHSSAKKYGISSTTYERNLKELMSAHFIEKVDDPNMAQFAPGKYRFTLGWKSV